MDDQARVWDVMSGKPIGPAFRSSQMVLSGKPVFSPDGQRFAVVNSAAEVWPTPIAERDDFETMRSRLRITTGLAMDARGGFSPSDSRMNGTSAYPTTDLDDGWHYRAAADLLSHGDHQAALWHTDLMTSSRPDDWFAHALRARALSALGDAANAVVEDSRAVALASAGQGLAWEMHRVFDALHARNWSEAVEALNVVLAIRPEDKALQLERAWARARLGDWAGAGDDMEEGGKGQKLSILFFYHRALLSLNAGDSKAYRRVCERILRSRAMAAAASDPIFDTLTGWICGLGPDGLDDYRPALDLVRPLAHPGAGLGDRKALISYGALLYRAGRYDEAIACLMRDQTEWKDQGSSQGLAFSAMAHQRLGNHQEALRCLAKIVDQEVPTGRSSDEFWNNVEIRTLRQEAVRLTSGVPLPTNVFAP